MKRQPLVFIVTINWNGLDDTADCLNSLKKITYRNYKIVVVDNGSRNNEASKLKSRFPSIKLIKNKINLGYSKANNQGIRWALKNNAEYILLLNNDTIVKSNFLNILIEYAEKNHFKGILAPKILYYNSNKIWAMGGKLSIITSIPKMIGQGKDKKKYNEIIEPDYAPGCAMLFNSYLLKKIGLLDPRYFAYYEDTDFSFRALRAGYKIRVVPKSIIWHKISQSTKQKQANKIGKTQAFLLAKNGLVFGSLNYNNIKKVLYLISQAIIKLPLYLIFKADSFKSAKAYIKGFVAGCEYIINNTDKSAQLNKE